MNNDEEKFEVHDIEALDRKRLRFLEGYLVGFVLFMALMLVRFFFRADNMNTQPIGHLVLIGLLATLLLQVCCIAGSLILAAKIRKNPRLAEAMNDELYRLYFMQSWLAAYLGAAGSALFFAIVYQFYPICDPMLTALTAIIVGAGAHQISFYLKYRLS